MVSVGDEDVLHVGKRRAAVPSRPQHRGRRVSLTFARLRVGEIDQPVLGIPRMKRHVEQAAEAGRQHLPAEDQSVSGRARRCGSPVDGPAARYEHAAIGKKREAPRMIEPLGEDRDVDATTAGADVPRTRAQRVDGRCGTPPAAARPRASPAAASFRSPPGAGSAEPRPAAAATSTISATSNDVEVGCTDLLQRLIS